MSLHSTVVAVYTCAHTAMTTASNPPDAPAKIILTAMMEGMAWYGRTFLGVLVAVERDRKKQAERDQTERDQTE